MSSGYALHPEAFADLDDIRHYIAQGINPTTTRALSQKLFEEIGPRSGRKKRSPGWHPGEELPPLTKPWNTRLKRDDSIYGLLTQDTILSFRKDSGRTTLRQIYKGVKFRYNRPRVRMLKTAV